MVSKTAVHQSCRSITGIEVKQLFKHLELFRKNPGCWDEISLIKFLKNYYIYQKLNLKNICVYQLITTFFAALSTKCKSSWTRISITFTR